MIYALSYSAVALAFLLYFFCRSGALCRHDPEVIYALIGIAVTWPVSVPIALYGEVEEWRYRRQWDREYEERERKRKELADMRNDKPTTNEG